MSCNATGALAAAAASSSANVTVLNPELEAQNGHEARGLLSSLCADDIKLGIVNNVAYPDIKKTISKAVLRKKLRKMRHLCLEKAISPQYLDSIFPALLDNFHPQKVTYNGGRANVKEWKISCCEFSVCRPVFRATCSGAGAQNCFLLSILKLIPRAADLEVMEGGVPCTDPNLELLELFSPLLRTCDVLFAEWYRQQHACNVGTTSAAARSRARATAAGYEVKRQMTFVTRYTPAKGEQALLKVGVVVVVEGVVEVAAGLLHACCSNLLSCAG